MKKILIANRGEIARRIIRTCREMGIAAVAVYSDPDRHALFVSEADEAVPLGGASAAQSYLRIEAILEAAQRTASDAIHPGYGFLAENAEFARACVAAGRTLIGPSPDVIAAMGSKIEAKRRMKEAGIPVLASIDVGEQSATKLTKQIKELGWPVLVKASAGGGGRGMRIVRKADELADALKLAREESQNAFGDDTLFIEKYVEAPRHVEFQIFGDTHGRVIHLFERECSIQRRHQKIIEETPSPALDDQLRAEMSEAAVRAGEAIGYVGAGTVEFLLTPDKKFYFLEVNTRLQVEHPVTECVTGLDLVRLQILVAEGSPLPEAACQAQLSGHAIEARLYAEDPQHDYRPSTGRLHRFRVPESPGIRIESGVADGSQITPFYDPLLAKIIVHAASREEASRQLAGTLAGTRIHGLRTNRELLVRILEHPEFLSGDTDTHFLERHAPAELGAPLCDTRGERLHAAAAALTAQAARRNGAAVLRTIPSGWRNNPSQLERCTFEFHAGKIEVRYRRRRDGLELEIDNEPVVGVRIVRCTADGVDMEVDGVRRTYEVHRVENTHYVDSPLGASELVELERFPQPEEEQQAGSLVAPLPGIINEIRTKIGDTVAAGDVLLVIESMKTLYHVAAPVAGRVTELRVEPAAHVEAGALLAVIEEEPSE